MATATAIEIASKNGVSSEIGATTIGKLGYFPIDIAFGTAIGANITGAHENNGQLYINGKELAGLIEAAKDGKLTAVANAAVGSFLGSITNNVYPNWESNSVDFKRLLMNMDAKLKNLPTSSTITSTRDLANAANPVLWATTPAPGSNTPNATAAANKAYTDETRTSAVEEWLKNWPSINTPAVKTEISNAINAGSDAASIELQLMNGDPKQSGPLQQTIKQFQAYYPALVAAGKTGATIAVKDPGTYESYLASYQAIVKSYLPGTALTRADMDALIQNNVTPTQLTERVKLAYEAANAAPQEVKDQLAAKYGVDASHLAMVFLDPKNGQSKVEDDLRARELLANSKGSNLSLPDAYKMYATVDAGINSLDAANKAATAAVAQQNLGEQSFGMQGQSTASSKQVVGSALPGFDQTQVADTAAVAQAQSERTQASRAGGQYSISQKTGSAGAGRAQQ